MPETLDVEDLLLRDDGDDPWSLLPAVLMRKAIAIRDYMIIEGRETTDPDITLRHLSELFVDAGLPLDRCVTIVGLLHAESRASMRAWNRGQGTSSRTFGHGVSADQGYAASPAAPAHEHRAWVIFNPQEVPVKTFDIVEELQAEGFTHYICAPTFLGNVSGIFTFATKAPQGFSDRDIAFLRATFPAIMACQEILVYRRLLREVTRTYVGAEPHERILSGDVKRGEVSSIRSAILFADMRDFTALTAPMSAEETTTLLNVYYDCIVPHIEGNGGEVLKFMADGILGIFRAQADGANAAARALLGAKQGLQAVATNASEPTFEVGVALHVGEVAYGNVGSGTRLDYTVIGRDVNLASRIAGLCGTLRQPLLVSSAFRDLTPGEAYADCGAHRLKGLADPETIFAPEDLAPPA